MAKRHKRSEQLRDGQTEILLEQVYALHEVLVPLLCDLKPQCDDYRAVLELHDALVSAIRKTTAEDPIWMQPRIWPKGRVLP